MHVDLDAFYASVEQRDHAQWRGRPVVVGAVPGKRGVVATCSYEARRFGVHSAMPISEASRRLPPDTVYVRPRMSHYVEVSRAIMAVLQSISPLCEKVSIDEAYLDVSGLERLIGAPQTIGQRTKDAILRAVELSASVGIGPNRLIAKLASDYRKPDGLTVITRERVAAFLDPLPLTVLRGVGKKAGAQLQRLGLRSVGDVRRVPIERLARRFGTRFAAYLQEQAHGIASDRVIPHAERKSISKETTFGQDISDPDTLFDTLSWAAQEVGHIARLEGRRGSVVTLKVRFKGFETHTRSHTLAHPSAADDVLLKHAWRLFEREPWSGRPVRLIGLGIAGWAEANPGQGDLFADYPTETSTPRERLYETLDEISRKFGKGSVRLGLRRKE